MFSAGKVFYFNNFTFKNGAPTKPKYFIVLANIGNVTIIASLPTRTNNVPSFITIPHGCINHDERCYNCYVFEKGRIICDNGFSFELPTFIYGDQVDDYPFDSLDAQIEGVDFIAVGCLIPTELTSILTCIQSSTSTKKRILRHFKKK